MLIEGSQCNRHICVQLLDIRDFRKASVEDVCAVHERSYVLGLERLAQRGKNDIVDNAPTYITGTSFDDALQVALKMLQPCSAICRPAEC